MIFAGAVGRMLLVDPTPAFTAASRSRQLAATGKLQPSVGENTADAAAAVGIDSVSQSGEKTLAARLSQLSAIMSGPIFFVFVFFEGILLFVPESCGNHNSNGPLLFRRHGYWTGPTDARSPSWTVSRRVSRIFWVFTNIQHS